MAQEPIRFAVLGDQIETDKSASWANSAAAGTVVNVDFSLPRDKNRKYGLTIHNPSGETALTINVLQKKQSLGGADRYAKQTTINIPINSTEIKTLEFLFLSSDCRLQVSNDTAIGLSGAFTSTVRLEVIE
jgi:hypothetical protein